MSVASICMVLVAGVVGGALNSVVGGGSFVAFPALLLAGVPAVAANATTTLALWPGALASAVAYRKDINQPRRVLLAFSAASLVGGGAGAVVLLKTSNDTFVRMIPWLLLFATVLFTFGGRLTALLRRSEGHDLRGGELAMAALMQLVISIYGGFFGGGMGIMMLATWSVLGMVNIHAMNGMRSVMGTLINGVALAAFVAAGAVAWRPGLIMVVGATSAGYLGAALARRVDPRKVKTAVIAIAWGMTGYFFLRNYGVLP